MISTLNIGGYSYAIDVQDDLHTVDAQGRKEHLNGHIVYCDLEIHVNANVAEGMHEAILLHEALHGILYHAGQTEQHEQHILALGYGLIPFLRGNPDFVRQVMGWTETQPITSTNISK